MTDAELNRMLPAYTGRPLPTYVASQHRRHRDSYDCKCQECFLPEVKCVDCLGYTYPSYKCIWCNSNHVIDYIGFFAGYEYGGNNAYVSIVEDDE